jgi:hypothetical protein
LEHLAAGKGIQRGIQTGVEQELRERLVHDGGSPLQGPNGGRDHSQID